MKVGARILVVEDDRSIARLVQLELGLPEYQQTAALWVRGILREHYGVDTRGIAWRTGGERVPISLPDGLDVRPLGEDLQGALAAGRIDALVAPRPPAAFEDGCAPVGRLWPDYRAEEVPWHRATGFFPIMHRSEEHTSELQSRQYLVCSLL